MNPLFVIIPLAILLIIVLIASINIVPQAHAYVIERLGTYHTTWSPGLHLKVPFIDKVAKKNHDDGAGSRFSATSSYHEGQCAYADRHGRLLSDHRL